MADPVFQMHPEDGPLRLAPGPQPSDPFPFEVDASNTVRFLRFNASDPTCAPTGETEPLIELRLALGKWAAVPRAPETVTIEDQHLTAYATASWTREPGDMFLVRLDIDKPSELKWQVRLTNKAQKELFFVWVVSDLEEDTRQPRIFMPSVQHRTASPGGFIGNIVVNVANVGTRELVFFTEGSTDLGGGFFLKSLTSPIQPSECGPLVIGVASTEHGSDSTDFVLQADTRDEAERTLHLSRSKPDKEKAEGKEGKDSDGGPSKHLPDMMGVSDLFPRPLIPGLAWAGAASLNEHFIPPELRPDLSTSALAYEDPAP
ncbi:hypothetical protein BN159_0092 [Streptomyces davaonensis JCM 4913]|uniref:Uncharacterized protein n=1 Tax=Streptomyces davaonensis (strain DSM 101723 / JCM 4913 / KCC S-0913 / 768) TaxID=1214101 RepID=K4QSD7_STRDJ|nr:hypothetical protein [Streptomyces davaonensis]CCK24471.1 hypothetical protein BN159_0092 [Streptomyces davaonensis JCM 4913]